MDSFDLLVIGGGINGAAIARDAAVREKKVLLVEKDDLAQHTSSASSKLIHGGLRYLEQYDFRLVREALKEREILLRTAPHVVRPLRFVLPHAEGMRPWWMLRAGLALYDLLAIGGSLPRARRSGREDLAPLKSGTRRAATYWDAWVEDSRLVVLNALDAAERGAEIATRTALVSARREGDAWRAVLSTGREIRATAIVNAAGPWVEEVLHRRLGEESESRLRLVRGSHIVVPAIHDGEQAYILQQPDGRIVFALPFESRFTLIGTTDIQANGPEDAAITPEETRYLCESVDRYFQRDIGPHDVVWSFAGIRALHDDGAADAKSVTRDYKLELDADPGPKLLSIFGGKITTARALAAEAMEMLRLDGRKSTSWAELPGGDVYPDFLAWLDDVHRWMPAPLAQRLSQSYGTRMRAIVGDASDMKALGRDFGAGLTEAEIAYLVRTEFARNGSDILWRRSKLGLHMTERQRREVDRYVAKIA